MTRSPLFARLLLIVLPLLAFACDPAPEIPPGFDAAPESSTVEPPTAKAGTIPSPTIYRSCDQIAKDAYASLSDEALDALLGQLAGARCEGSLFCEAGGAQNCGSASFNPYSGHAIGCECFDGKFSCRDYRAEARACGAFRLDGGTH